MWHEGGSLCGIKEVMCVPAGMCADAMCGRYVLQKVLFVAIDTYLRRCFAWQVQVSGGAVCGRYVLYAVLCLAGTC